ncbi:hypothetical protein PCANB_001440 [Pneumocystis canis]|nr:hypothetical protein PCANB_001440 [Pneumocystis canis]
MKNLFIWGTKFTWVITSAFFIYINQNNNFFIQCQSSVNQDLNEDELNFNEDNSISKRMEKLIKIKQSEILKALEAIDTQKFIQDVWEKEGIVGKSCVLQKGDVFEKAGVNISIVRKKLSSDIIDHKIRENYKNLISSENLLDFFICGLSLIIHPCNPMAPSIHMNCRYFQTENSDLPKIWWFGGGVDLTPSYLFDDDAIHFHDIYKKTCDRYDETYYPKFKKWCDEYFYNKHRGECRGIGGIFFDNLNDKNPETLFSFIKDCIDTFLPSYIPILLRRKDMDYTPDEKQFQQIIRGRYVEFNLIYDRGTAFGFNIPGSRIESILMALPLNATWMYRYVPKDPREKRLIEILQHPKEWI